MEVTPDSPSAAADTPVRISKLQIVVMTLCAIVVMLDGFDTQAIGYVAPRIAQDWGIAPSVFGPIFSAGLLGLACGNFFLGPLADKFGRKTIILISVAMFGSFSLLTSTADNLDHLLIYRFLTGIGLGAALPNLIALTSEYAPERLRATAVMIMFCGFPLGSTIGGFIAGPLMDVSSWRAIFILGGVAPLLMLPVLMLFLPESARYLAARGGSEGRIGSILRRIDPKLSVADFVASVRAESGKDTKGFTVVKLFTEGRTPSTLLLWGAFFMNLLVMYFLVNWLPTLIREAGLPLRLAILSAAILNLGGVAGAIVLARMIDKLNPYLVLGINYAISAFFIALISFGATSGPLMLFAAAAAGVGVVGGQIGCNAIAAAQYPTAIRATGVGWALGVGRIGAIVGPLVGGGLLAAGWTPQAIILLAAAPALAASVSVFGLGLVQRKATSVS